MVFQKKIQKNHANKYKKRHNIKKTFFDVLPFLECRCTYLGPVTPWTPPLTWYMSSHTEYYFLLKDESLVRLIGDHSLSALHDKNDRSYSYFKMFQQLINVLVGETGILTIQPTKYEHQIIYMFSVQLGHTLIGRKNIQAFTGIFWILAFCWRLYRCAAGVDEQK